MPSQLLDGRRGSAAEVTSKTRRGCAVSCSPFWSKAELFSAINSEDTLQPAALMRFQRNRVRCSLWNMPRRRKLASPPHGTEEPFLRFPQQVGQYDGASVIMQHRAAHGWSCGPVTPVALWASGCHCPSCTSGLLGARGVPNGSVARKLISALPLQLLWGSPACTPGVPSWFVESLRTSVEY